MKEDRYSHLIGKNKKQVIEELGDEFNFYPSKTWTYVVKKDWIGRKYILTIFFEEEIVVKLKIKKH